MFAILTFLLVAQTFLLQDPDQTFSGTMLKLSDLDPILFSGLGHSQTLTRGQAHRPPFATLSRVKLFDRSTCLRLRRQARAGLISAGAGIFGVALTNTNFDELVSYPLVTRVGVNKDVQRDFHLLYKLH